MKKNWQYCRKWYIMEDALQGFYEIHGISWSSKIRAREPNAVLKRSTFNLVSAEHARSAFALYLPRQRIIWLSLTSITVEVCDIICVGEKHI